MGLGEVDGAGGVVGLGEGVGVDKLMGLGEVDGAGELVGLDGDGAAASAGG
jgi:hypothetical protein